MTTKKIHGPWIKWHGGECPVPPDAKVGVKLRCGIAGEARACDYYWNHNDDGGDIVEYCTVTEQTDLEAADTIDTLRAQLAEVENQRDYAIQQAQIWKLEAASQKATVAECYQICTDATGEPGDWHGAEPVRALKARFADAQKDAERWRFFRQAAILPVAHDHPFTILAERLNWGTASADDVDAAIDAAKGESNG